MIELAMGKIPLAEWVSTATDWITSNLSAGFDIIQKSGTAIMDTVTAGLTAVPFWLMIVVVTFLAILVSGRKVAFPIFTFLGLVLIANQGLWADLMNTVTLVLLSSLVSIIIGIPLGIWMAKSELVAKIVQPILDFMQTMPGFVYLIPAVAFFGIGVVPGVFASVIFALPPTVRMTNLGIRQVSTELVEAADSFGSTPRQKLFKLEFPLAKGTILAGVNQTTMLALSMVVIASMIGAPGLGRGVLAAVQSADIGKGFVNGIALVILAIIIDRFTQKLNVAPTEKQGNIKLKKWKQRGALLALLVLILGGMSGLSLNKKVADKNVELVYMNWDSEVASINVLSKAMEDRGFDVKKTALDNTVAWQTVANGQADGMVSAWLPNTHETQWKKFSNSVELLGPNLKGAKVGLVVPSYMKANSIEDLKSQADKSIIGIEPGAGVMAAAEHTMKDYSNLKDWNLVPSSSGAMTVALGEAIKQHKDIVITGWSPHWMFNKYDLKYLEDPKGAMGKAEDINTIVRKGLKEDNPEAYKVLDKFNWSQEDMESVMLDVQNGKTPEEAADSWVKTHKEQVDEWFED
ncbi:ABC transporter permease/substrate binding protein [Lactococcus garvieae]|jgi:glycine betaine/proline transport system substrate-binding protein|uniref:Glycine betaine ABC transport system, permease protein OpuAB / glycine betaine-binding protein OpuAC n=1 Tax=Lactococcus garvieae DCC43 TaxID=1231377 RepID=K2PU16_9LACT|nr:ABC transporter permease/substrate binding protein [Lactococcus garvieae]EKF50961.1 Glycine betaine ABC transport system, permease protein OpuAB / glycine betaine-binding protein OpuAC [Lactococcus garvieae DCC43]QPS71767.1 ABC transporter permease/substrate binding protein [Lactococcus garvieae]